MIEACDRCGNPTEVAEETITEDNHVRCLACQAQTLCHGCQTIIEKGETYCYTCANVDLYEDHPNRPYDPPYENYSSHGRGGPVQRREE
jgi:hypothetical protein